MLRYSMTLPGWGGSLLVGGLTPHTPLHPPTCVRLNETVLGFCAVAPRRYASKHSSPVPHPTSSTALPSPISARSNTASNTGCIVAIQLSRGMIGSLLALTASQMAGITPLALGADLL